MMTMYSAAWVLTILLIIGGIANIVKAARKNNASVIAVIIGELLQIYLYYCVGIFDLL